MIMGNVDDARNDLAIAFLDCTKWLFGGSQQLLFSFQWNVGLLIVTDEAPHHIQKYAHALGHQLKIMVREIGPTHQAPLNPDNVLCRAFELKPSQSNLCNGNLFELNLFKQTRRLIQYLKCVRSVSSPKESLNQDVPDPPLRFGYKSNDPDHLFQSFPVLLTSFARARFAFMICDHNCNNNRQHRANSLNPSGTNLGIRRAKINQVSQGKQRNHPGDRKHKLHHPAKANAHKFALAFSRSLIELGAALPYSSNSGGYRE